MNIHHRSQFSGIVENIWNTCNDLIPDTPTLHRVHLILGRDNNLLFSDRNVGENLSLAAIYINSLRLPSQEGMRELSGG